MSLMRTPLRIVSLLVLTTLVAQTSGPVHAQTALDPMVTIRTIANLPGGASDRAVRVVHDQHHDVLLVLSNSGNIHAFDPANPSWGFDLWYTRQDHGTPFTGSQSSWGMDVADDGTIYLLGNEDVGETQTRAVIRRGEMNGGTRQWTTVATTEAYSLSRTWFDHRFNGIVLSPDGTMLYMNSGSRTDHGEMYNGIREEGLTAAIFQVPADASELVMPNDREALRDGGFLFAEGTRNTYDLTFAPNGHLFGADNAGDRDDPEELNWLREGEHYGFPWRAGTNDNPQQFPGYDPAQDPLVLIGRNPFNQADTGWYFSNDPTFPERPDVDFVDPIPNWGPDANIYRDEETGLVRRASDDDEPLRSFTGHRSPLGLVFDRDSVLVNPFNGGAFLLSFNTDADEMLRRLNGHGEDLLHLDLFFEDGEYQMHSRRIAEGFNQPIDAEMVGNTIYVAEYGNPYAQNPGPMRLLAVDIPVRAQTSAELTVAEARLDLNVYPNPFGSLAWVTVQHPSEGNLRATLHDALGRQVALISDGWRAPGEVRIPIDGARLASGVYIVRVETSTATISRSVIRIRD
jgi:hypothetical protein